MTSSGFLFVILVVVVILLVRSELKRRRLEREQFIRSYVFPGEVLDEAFKDLPQITPKQAHLVARALRQFFLARQIDEHLKLVLEAIEHVRDNEVTR